MSDTIEVIVRYSLQRTARSVAISSLNTFRSIA